MYKLFCRSIKIHWTTAGETLPFDQEPWQVELDSADRVLCSRRRVGQVDSWHYPYWSEAHTKRWDNDIKMGHHRRPKSQMPRSMNVKDSTMHGISVPDAEVSCTVKQLALQHFPASGLSNMKMTFNAIKRLFLYLKCAHTFEHTHQSFCKTTIWLTNYSFTKRTLCLQGIWYHPLQGTTCMTSRKPPCLFCSHLTTPHHYTIEYCLLIPHTVKP
jgi:hypothetical protein